MPGIVNPVRPQGYDQVRKRLQQLIKNLPKAVAEAAKAELTIEKQISVDRTPWKTHELQRSHRVIEPVITRGRIETGITVGNEKTASYDVIIHEDLDMFHPHGEAKFLEKTLNESRPYLAGRIVRRIELKTLVT